MVFKGYTKRDTSIIKGFGILCIVLHNYFHWLAPSPGENEFDFLPGRVTGFFNLLIEKPGEFVNILFSYLGHYGVQLFVFVSGFGLALSMMNHRRTWESFVLTRLKKLYPLLLVGVVFFIFSKVLIDGAMISRYDKTEIGYKLLLIHTLIPGSGTSINGPWWFFGLIFQLYLLFPYLFKLIEKWKWKAFAVVCVVSYALIFLFKYVLTAYHGTVIIMNAPGHLPEFCLGILLAFCKDKKINVLWLVAALVTFCLGNYFEVFYPLTFLSLTIVMVFVYQGIKSLSIRKKEFAGFLSYFGGISMALFATHAVLRDPVLEIANTWGTSWGHFMSGMMFLLIAWAVAIPAKALYEFVESWLDKIHIRESRATHALGVICQIAFLVLFVYVFCFFIAQNLNKFDKKIVFTEKNNVSEVISANDEYYDLLVMTPDTDMLSLQIEGSFEMTKLDTVAALPTLVVEIEDLLWDRIVIPNDFNFSYQYLRPFNKKVNGRRIKVYLWNNHHCSVKVENVDVSMAY